MPTFPVMFEQYWVPAGWVAPLLEQALEPLELELEEPELELELEEPELELDEPELEPEEPEELEAPELE